MELDVSQRLYRGHVNREYARFYNESEIQAGISSGKAQIDGYEYESVSTEFLDIDKGRDFDIDSGYSLGAEIGNYVVIDNMNKFLDEND